MDDINVRVSYLMNKKVSDEYKKGLEQELATTVDSKKKGQYSKLSFYDDLLIFSITFDSRVIIGEKLYGENKEDNPIRKCSLRN